MPDLSILALTEQGEEVDLGTPASLVLNIEASVAADSVVFYLPYRDDLPLIARVSLLDGDKLIFSGICDTQTLIVDTGGSYIQLCARSYAALLIDNEAHPCTYTNPTPQVIFDNHLKPFGISSFNYEGAVRKGALTVKKGMSHWQVLNDFCRCFLNKSPRVTVEKQVIMEGIPQGEALAFGLGGIPYTQLSLERNFCERLSEVYVKAKEADEGYHMVFRDNDAISRGIVRRRYLNCGDSMNPVFPEEAQKMLDRAKASEVCAMLCVPGKYVNILGQAAVIIGHDVGSIKVSKIKYTLSSSGEKTYISLSGY